MFTTEQRMFAVLHHRHISKSYRKSATELGMGKSSISRWSKELKISQNLKRCPRKRSSAKSESILSLVEIIVKTDPFVTIHKLKWILQDTHRISVSLSTVYRCMKTLKMSYKVASRSPQHQVVDPPILSRNK